jgi:hypothetical protein
MPDFTITLSEEEAQQLQTSAQNRELTPDALIQRWVRERLVHERERAAGGGKDLSPRARRRAEDG